MNLKNKYIYSAVVACALGLTVTSCNDELDVERPSQADISFVFSNVEGAQNAINGVYVLFCEDPYTSRMSNCWLQNTDVEAMSPSAGKPSGGHRSDLWGLQSALDEGFADIYKAWNNNLEAIELANNVIEGCDNSDLSAESEIKQIKGEAVCLKAYRYLLLCNFWGDVPLYTVSSKYGEELDKPRVDKNIIYSHVLQQLVDVEGSMKFSDVNTGGTERCTRDFALGLIAKIAMFRAGYGMTADGTMKRADDYLDVAGNSALAVTYTDLNGNVKTARTHTEYCELAKNYAMKLINLKGRELRTDFDNIFAEQEQYLVKNNDEILYQVAFVQNRGGDVGWAIGVPNTGTCPNGNTTAQVAFVPTYYQSFHAGDQRREATVARYSHDNDTIKIATATSLYPAKWDRYEATAALGSSSSKGTGINWPVMRYSEVLLLLAEAENEINGPTALAQEQLTKVRARAFHGSDNYADEVTNYVANVSQSPEKFFNAIVDERAWEFGGEGLRRFDLIRWNLYGTKINETIKAMNAWGIAANKEMMEDPNNIPDSYRAEVEKYKDWADILYFDKPLKAKDKNQLVWLNDVYHVDTDSATIEAYQNAKRTANWGKALIKTVTTYLYNDKEYSKVVKLENKEEGTVTYTLDEKVTVTVNKEEETGITKKVVYQSSDYATRLYRGYTGDEDYGTGAVPYLMPIGTTTLSSSNVLTNDGYGFNLTKTGEGTNRIYATIEKPYK